VALIFVRREHVVKLGNIRFAGPPTVLLAYNVYSRVSCSETLGHIFKKLFSRIKWNGKSDLTRPQMKPSCRLDEYLTKCESARGFTDRPTGLSPSFFRFIEPFSFYL